MGARSGQGIVFSVDVCAHSLVRAYSVMPPSFVAKEGNSKKKKKKTLSEAEPGASVSPRDRSKGYPK